MSRRMIIRIHGSGHVLWDSWLGDADYGITDDKQTDELNASARLQFRVPPAHPYFGEISEQTILQGVDTAYVKDRFFGPVASVSRTTGNVVALGTAELLNRVQMPPYDFAGPIEDYLQLLVDNYNAKQPDDSLQVTIGQVTVTDPNDYIVRSSETFSDGGIWTHMLEKLPRSSLGGYLDVYRLNGNIVLDYLATSGPTAAQGIAFGRNLRNHDTLIDAGTTYTAVRPLGARLDEDDLPVIDPVSENRVNISTASANTSGSMVIQDDDQVERLGYRENIVRWDDVHDPNILYQRGQSWLASNAQVKITVTATPVDLADVDEDEQPWEVGMMVPTTAPDYEGTLQLRAIARSYTNPADKACQLGAETVTWSSLTAAQIARQANSVTQWVVSNYATNERVNSTTANIWSEVNQLAEQIALIVAQDIKSLYDGQSALMTQIASVIVLADSITSQVSEVRETVYGVDEDGDGLLDRLQQEIDERTSIARQDADAFHFGNGQLGTEIVLQVNPELRISVMVSGAEKTFWTPALMDVERIHVRESIDFDRWAIIESGSDDGLRDKYLGA